jgi:hypothetical protein
MGAKSCPGYGIRSGSPGISGEGKRFDMTFALTVSGAVLKCGLVIEMDDRDMGY